MQASRKVRCESENIVDDEAQEWDANLLSFCLVPVPALHLNGSNQETMLYHADQQVLCVVSPGVAQRRTWECVVDYSLLSGTVSGNLASVHT